MQFNKLDWIFFFSELTKLLMTAFLVQMLLKVRLFILSKKF